MATANLIPRHSSPPVLIACSMQTWRDLGDLVTWVMTNRPLGGSDQSCVDLSPIFCGIDAALRLLRHPTLGQTLQEMALRALTVPIPVRLPDITHYDQASPLVFGYHRLEVVKPWEKGFVSSSSTAMEVIL